MNRLGHILFLILLSGCYLTEQEAAPDQTVWDYALPKEVGLSNAVLQNLNTRIRVRDFEEINGLIIIKDGYIVFENYYPAQAVSSTVGAKQSTLRERNTKATIGRGSLSFALAAVGVALDLNVLSLEDPIALYLPEYEDVFEADTNKQKITIAHLLLQKSGLAWNEIQRFSEFNSLNQMKNTADWVRYILEQPMEAPPGFRFSINSATGVLLAKIVENASQLDFESFLNKYLLTPLTISTFEIETDPTGNYNAGDGISISLLDWSKLAYLMLEDGIWSGRKVIDPGFIADATSDQSVISTDLTMGYLWQKFGADYSEVFGVPYQDMYYLPGHFGRHLYVVPSENMIVAIFANNLFGVQSLNLFVEVTYSFQ